MDRDRPALSRPAGWPPGRPLLSGRAALLLALPALGFVALFFVWPVANILALGVAPDGTPAPGGLVAAWAEPFVLDVVLFTLGLALVSTLLTVVAGLPAAWVLARFDVPGRSLLRAIAIVPFVLPTVVVGSAFLALGIEGWVGAIIVAHVFYDLAIVIRIVGGSWGQLDRRTEDAARALGASPLRVFAEVTWPLLRPAVLSAASIVFLFTATSFGVVLLLGGPRDVTLEVEIWRQTAILLDLPAAAALTILQLVGVFALLVWSARAQERLAIGQRALSAEPSRRRPRGAGERILVGAILSLTVLVLVVPLVVLVARSLALDDGVGLDAYARLFSTDPATRLPVAPIEAVANSIGFAVATVLIAGSLGLLAAIAVGYRRGWLPRTFDALVMLPLGTSAVIVGFGFLVSLDTPPLDLRTSIVLIPIAHALVALPFVLRATLPLVRSIDPRLREAAAVLGAAPGRAWREVDGPVIVRATLVAAAFAFAVSMGEFGATLFIARPDSVTLPLAIFRLLGQPGAANVALAMAMSTVLMVVVALAVLSIERLRGRGTATF